MNYDFDRVIDRRNTNSLKWNVGDHELPMWVADMDFRTAPEIISAIQKIAAHGVFGYSEVPDEWYESYTAWWKKRHGLEMEKEKLIFCTGVIPAISSLVRKLTTPAEKILIQTPVYNIFFNSILNNGRQVLEAPLVYFDGHYTVNWNDLEKKLSDPQTTLMILCNPHNPIGRIWDKDTLSRIGELCCKNHVTVISDEIHCDLTSPSKSYIPFASVSDVCRNISITCIAPTKTFNIAGIQTAAVYAPNPRLYNKAFRCLNTDEVAEPNAFSVDAAVAAFSKSGNWLDSLRNYIYENKPIAEKYFRENIPQITLISSDATYLLWIDCSRISDDTSKLTNFIRSETGLYISSGKQYGECGKKFIRVNIACPKLLLLEGLEKLAVGIRKYPER